MATVTEVADGYMDRLVELDPIVGTDLGDTRSDSRLPDFSPSGLAARDELITDTLRALEGADVIDDERAAGTVLQTALTDERASNDLGDAFREVRNWYSPVDRIRGAFDLMPTDEPDHWPAVVERMAAVPLAVAGIEATLREGLARNLPAARRQAGALAQQARTWGGVNGDGYFTRLLHRAPPLAGGLHDHAARAVEAAETALRRFASFLMDEYTPRATERDGVGRERYAVAARAFTGLDLDLDATYEWGWSELARLRTEIDGAAAQVTSGGFAAARDLLNNDPDRAIHGVDAFRAWLQELTDRTIAELDGRHFDIAPPARRVECMIAPPGSQAAMYYTSPSEDWSRPGRTWYPAGDRTVFPTWEEVSTAYHEGVPGHHLQAVATMTAEPALSRFQRYLFIPGHGEGWALYSERLMAELGFHQAPDTLLGMLVAEDFRAARVVVDIGLHLELAIPGDWPAHAGEHWNFELARTFMEDHVAQGGDFVTSEVERYLGMPAQAICYQVGQREWLDIRKVVHSRQGAAFDLRRFHSQALGLGPMGLAQLRAELTKLA